MTPPVAEERAPIPIRPPFLALVCLAAAWGIDRAWPGPGLPAASPWVSLVCFGLGAGLAGWALRTFFARRTTHEPFGTPVALVTDGPFRFTRNPMYVGVALVLTGIACLFGRVVLLAAPVGFVLLMTLAQIPFEERRMHRLFGDAYREYCARVRRWI